MRTLLITSECSFSNTSAAIRNQLFIRGLSRICELDIVEIKQFEDSIEIFKVDSFVKRKYVIDLGLKKTKRKHKYSIASKLKEKIKCFLKSIIPDNISLLDIGIHIDLELNDYDYIISSSDPKGVHISTVRWLSKYKKSREFLYIQYWGDPWFDDISRYTNIFTKNLEKCLLKSADYVIYNSKKTVLRQISLHPFISSKVQFLPRGVVSDGENIVVKAIDNARIVYAGDFNSKYRNIVPVIEACSSLGLTLEIFGDGDVELSKYSNVKHTARLTKEKLEEVTGDAAVKVILLNSHGGQLPGKVYDLMVSSSNVLLILDGAFRKEDIPISERFYICENNKDSICKAVNSIFSMNEDIRFDLSKMSIEKLVSDLFEKRLVNNEENHRIL